MRSKKKLAQVKTEPTRKLPWNRGRTVGQMLPLTREQVRTIRFLLQAETDSNPRDLALFCTAIDTMLRASDLLSLSVADVTDHTGIVRDEFPVRQRKTGNGTIVGITPETRAAIDRWILRITAHTAYAGPRPRSFTRRPRTSKACASCWDKNPSPRPRFI